MYFFILILKDQLTQVSVTSDLPSMRLSHTNIGLLNQSLCYISIVTSSRTHVWYDVGELRHLCGKFFRHAPQKKQNPQQPGCCGNLAAVLNV